MNSLFSLVEKFTSSLHFVGFKVHGSFPHISLTKAWSKRGFKLLYALVLVFQKDLAQLCFPLLIRIILVLVTLYQFPHPRNCHSLSKQGSHQVQFSKRLILHTANVRMSAVSISAFWCFQLKGIFNGESVSKSQFRVAQDESQRRLYSQFNPDLLDFGLPHLCSSWLGEPDFFI